MSAERATGNTSFEDLTTAQLLSRCIFLEYFSLGPVLMLHVMLSSDGYRESGSSYNFRSPERRFLRTFVAGNESSMELSLPGNQSSIYP